MDRLCTLVLDEKPALTFLADERWLRNEARGRLRCLAYYSFDEARVWARVIPEGVVEWETTFADSPRRLDGLEPYHYDAVPGSLLRTFEDGVPDFFPTELLERELLVHATFLRLSSPEPTSGL